METLSIFANPGKQTSILINSSWKTLHTVRLTSVRIHTGIIQNDLENLKHLTLQRMTSADNIFILMKKCPKSLTHLSLPDMDVRPDLNGLDCDWKKLESLIK